MPGSHSPSSCKKTKRRSKPILKSKQKSIKGSRSRTPISTDKRPANQDATRYIPSKHRLSDNVRKEIARTRKTQFLLSSSGLHDFLYTDSKNLTCTCHVGDSSISPSFRHPRALKETLISWWIACQRWNRQYVALGRHDLFLLRSNSGWKQRKGKMGHQTTGERRRDGNWGAHTDSDRRKGPRSGGLDWEF